MRVLRARSSTRSSYTPNQYSKGQGVSRSPGCVHGHPADLQSSTHGGSGRYHKANCATFSDYALRNPFAQGAFRWVAKGRYTEGSRQGELCVTKWFKTGAVFSDDYFTLDIRAVDKALEIVDKFNELNIVSKTIKINIPEVWTTYNAYGESTDEKSLIEPWIEDYEKFNSNTGWYDDSTNWGEVMQALSHFSYHITGGNLVLCDLQGGIYRHEVVLSDPVILSRNRDYGVTDLGPKGISSFFSQHACNRFCRPHWTQPANPTTWFNPTSSTSMMKHTVPTAHSRQNLSSRVRLPGNIGEEY